MVHRNISPENILVFKENDKVSFKINDFGLTKRNDNTKTIKIGTPQYKAPELIKDNKNKFNYKSEVDIWALGCVYYEIIARESLFIGI